MTDMKDGAITVGVPVFNGESLIEEALLSLMADKSVDLVVRVSDNASKDSTQQIVKKISAPGGTHKIDYIRHSRNIGAVANFRSVVESCHSEYFAWRAYDDLSDPGYFTLLRQRLEENPDAVLAAPHVITTRIGTSKLRHRPFTATSSDPFELLGHSQAGWMYGLFRTRFLQQAIRSVHENYPHLWAWDHLILFHAILHGGIVGSNEAVFQQRLNNYVKKASAGHSRSQRREIVAAYYHYCTTLIDDRTVFSGNRYLMRLAVMRHINRRVLRLRKLIF